MLDEEPLESDLEIMKQIAECWVYALANNADHTLCETMLRDEIKKNDNIMAIHFEHNNFCIFLELVDGSQIELCTNMEMQNDEWVYSQRLSV